MAKNCRPRSNPERCVACTSPLEAGQEGLCPACAIDWTKEEIRKYEGSDDPRACAYVQAAREQLGQLRRRRGAKRNPAEPKAPVAVDQVVMTIWTLFESRYPDDEGDNLNPIHVEKNKGGRWVVGFDDWVWSYGLNDTYTYSPKTKKWEVYLGDVGITRRGWATAAVLHRIDRIMDPTMTRANPGTDLPRVKHETRGKGRVAGFTHSTAGDRVLAYVYWDDGRPTGTWDVFDPSFKIIDKGKFARMLMAWRAGRANPTLPSMTPSFFDEKSVKVGDFVEVVAPMSQLELGLADEGDLFLVERIFMTGPKGDKTRIAKIKSDSTGAEHYVHVASLHTIVRENPALEAPRYLQRVVPAGNYQIYQSLTYSDYPMIYDASSLPEAFKTARRAAALEGSHQVVIYDCIGGWFDRVQ